LNVYDIVLNDTKAVNYECRYFSTVTLIRALWYFKTLVNTN